MPAASDERECHRSEQCFTLNAEGNFIHSPGKFVAVVGVERPGCGGDRRRAADHYPRAPQDVGKVVKYLDEKKMKRLV